MTRSEAALWGLLYSLLRRIDAKIAGNREILNQPESGIMGKGDKRTTRGKIFKGSYGKTRLHHPKKKTAAKARPAAKKS